MNGAIEPIENCPFCGRNVEEILPRHLSVCDSAPREVDFEYLKSEPLFEEERAR